MSIANLVTLEGDNQESICELLGMEESDNFLIKKYHTPEEKLYLNLKYPEYMGAIPAIIAKIASVGVNIGKSIASAVKQKRQKRKQASEAAKVAEQQKIAQYQYMMQLQAAEQAKKKNIQLMVMAGVPLVIILFLYMRRN